MILWLPLVVTETEREKESEKEERDDYEAEVINYDDTSQIKGLDVEKNKQRYKYN